ncbi:hypothetical protein SAMN06298216_1142 [Spirosomataceae bacterium TFI 002]|nr:hypothetical protein SAMN06298216_1142 [Spirosomataceae bacterium TFI 002]
MKPVIIALFTFLFLSIISCGDGDPVDPKGLDGTGYVAEYTEETIYLEDPNNTVIVAIDTATQVYTMNASAFSKEPKAGEVILVGGKMMRKVSSLEKKSGNYVIKTEDAALTDVIKNGTIAWDITPEWSEVAAIKMDGENIVDLSNGRIHGPIEAEISRGGIDHKIRISPQLENGKINSCEFKIQMVKKVGGSPTVVFTAEGKVKLPNQQTSISIKNQKLETFKANNKGISADITLSMSAAGGKSGSHSFELPGFALSIPIRFIPTPGGPVPLPIPVSIDIGIQFVSQLTIPDIKSSATASSKIALSADAGFEYQGTTVSTSGSIGDDKITDGTFDSASNIGFPIDIQFGVAFPRVGLNIAGQELAYVHTGFTTGSSLNWGPLCKSGYVKMVVEGGYELKVLGQTISEKKKIFAEKKKEAKSENCQ